MDPGPSIGAAKVTKKKAKVPVTVAGGEAQQNGSDK
jgi:hypothetical protein